MAENGTANVNGENNANEAAPNTADQNTADHETQGTQPVNVADPTTAMQSALASFDGLRVDAAIQVVSIYRGIDPISVTRSYC